MAARATVVGGVVAGGVVVVAGAVVVTLGRVVEAFGRVVDVLVTADD